MSTLHPSITDSRAVLQQNLERIQEQISCAAMRAHQSIPHILAVTKTQPVALVELAYSLGLRDFGENYVSEALEKINALQLRFDTLGTLIFIGDEKSEHFLSPGHTRR